MKILLVVEKPSVKRVIKDILDNHKDEFKDEYYFDCINPIFHLNDRFLLFRKYDNEIYSRGEKYDFKPLTLNHLEIPNDTFIEANQIKYSHIYKKEEMKNFDKIISICDPDDYGTLEFAKYLEVNNLDFNKVASFYLKDFTETSILKTLKSKPLGFDNVFQELCNKLKQNNFQCQYPRTKNILQLRMESGMNRKEFSNYFNIPYRTIENWEHNKAKCPEYLYDLIEYKLDKDGIFKGN